jgi:hypothetical protein
MKKIKFASAIPILLAGLLSFSSCFSPVSRTPSEDEQAVSSEGGNLEIAFLLPKFRGWDYGSHAPARVIDPQTAWVYIFAGDISDPDFEQTVPFSSSDINDHGFFLSWTTTIDLPFGYYPPQSMGVALLNASVELLAYGLNMEGVTLKLGTTVPLTIGCVPNPDNYEEVPVGLGPVGGAVDEGFLAYFGFLACHGEQYDIAVTRTGGTGEPDLYLFDARGTPVDYDYASGGSAGIDSYQAQENGVFYVGVLGYGGDVTSFQLSVTNTRTSLLPYPVINEVFFYGYDSGGGTGAVELYNPTNQDMDITNCSIEITKSGQLFTSVAPDGVILPAGGYLVVFSFEPEDDQDFDLSNMHYGWDVLGGGWWWWPDEDIAIKLLDDVGTEIDFVRFNASAAAGTWTGPNFMISGPTIARKVPSGPGFDTDSATDWQQSWGTLGLPNDFSGDASVHVEIH